MKHYLCAYIDHLGERFVEEGGVKERIHAARTGYRQQQVTCLKVLEEENRRLRITRR